MDTIEEFAKTAGMPITPKLKRLFRRWQESESRKEMVEAWWEHARFSPIGGIGCIDDKQENREELYF